MSGVQIFFGEDIIVAPCAPEVDIQAVAYMMRRSGRWLEVVPGIADLCVKYDPATMNEAEAERQFRSQFEAPVHAPTQFSSTEVFDADLSAAAAPDLEQAAQRLGISPVAFPAWLAERSYKVQMMGFQPGFAYLEDMEGTALPEIPRLDLPRQLVKAGSIGLLGKRACIYALDGPGGWPIVGRVSESMFKRDDAQPFRLSPGQIIRFAPK